MTTSCRRHGRPTPDDTAWCHTGDNSCRRTIRTALTNIPQYFADLDTVRAKQTRFGGLATMGSVGKAQPLVVDHRFLPGAVGDQAERMAVQVIGGYVRRLCDMHQGHPPRTMGAACDLLLDNFGELAVMPWADDFMTDLLTIEAKLSRLVDRPAEAWYAGECGAKLGEHDGTSCGCACHTSPIAVCDLPGGCGLEYANVVCTRILYAQPDTPYVRCRDCGSSYDVAERRRALLTEAREHNATVEIITRVVTTFGDSQVRAERVSARIRKWAERGRIHAVGTRVVFGQLRPVYRIGDVLDLFAEDAS